MSEKLGGRVLFSLSHLESSLIYFMMMPPCSLVRWVLCSDARCMKYLPRPIQLGDRCRYFATSSKFPFSTSKPSTLEELRARAPMRIAKAIAQSDLGVSRREAERMLSMGIVTVNKECVSTPTFLVEAQDHQTRADG